jgi:hypothetical protein
LLMPVIRSTGCGRGTTSAMRALPSGRVIDTAGLGGSRGADCRGIDPADQSDRPGSGWLTGQPVGMLVGTPRWISTCGWAVRRRRRRRGSLPPWS